MRSMIGTLLGITVGLGLGRELGAFSEAGGQIRPHLYYNCRR